jgi:hypothetical protein
MNDPNRLKRIHVVNVRAKGIDKFVVILSDGSDVPWEVWIGMSQAERWNQ